MLKRSLKNWHPTKKKEQSLPNFDSETRLKCQTWAISVDCVTAAISTILSFNRIQSSFTAFGVWWICSCTVRVSWFYSRIVKGNKSVAFFYKVSCGDCILPNPGGLNGARKIQTTFIFLLGVFCSSTFCHPCSIFHLGGKWLRKLQRLK